MINLRVLAALVLQGIRVTHEYLTESLGLRTDEPSEFHPLAPWAVRPDLWLPTRERYYYRDKTGHVWHISPEKVLRWGEWTVVQEADQCGSGTTYFFREANRQTGQAAQDLQDENERR